MHAVGAVCDRVKRQEESRRSQVAVEKSCLVLPCDSVIQGQVWLYLPGIAEVDAGPEVRVFLAMVIRAGEVRIADSDSSENAGGQIVHQHIQEISVGPYGRRRRNQRRAERIAKIPVRRSVEALQIGSEPEAMRAALPVKVIGDFITTRVTALRRVVVVAGVEGGTNHRQDGRQALADAGRQTLLRGGREIVVAPVLILHA